MNSFLGKVRARRRVLIAGVAVLAVGLGGWAASKSFEPAPPVASWVMIDDPRPFLDNEADEAHRSRLASYRETQAALMMSPTVLATAVTRLKSQSPNLVADRRDPVGWLQAGLKIQYLSDVLWTVSMPGESRGVQALIVNTVTDAYLEGADDWEQGRRARSHADQGAVLAEYRGTLHDKRKAVRAAPTTEPERAAALHDEIVVLEEVSRRLGVAVEQARLEALRGPTIRRIAKATP